MPKTSTTTIIKKFRRRVMGLPWPSQMHAFRGSLLELCDDLLLDMGDEFLEDYIPTGPVPGSSPHTPVTYPDTVRTIPTPMQVQPTQESVVMIAPNQQPVENRPSIIRMPEGAAPHVQLSEIGTPSNLQVLPNGDNVQVPATPVMHVLPPGMQGAMAPTTGEVRMVKPGADPIQAMDNPELTQPLNP